MSQEGLEVLFDGVPDVPLGLLDGQAVTEAAWQTRAIGRVALVLGFLLDHDLEGVDRKSVV